VSDAITSIANSQTEINPNHTVFHEKLKALYKTVDEKDTGSDGLFPLVIEINADNRTAELYLKDDPTEYSICDHDQILAEINRKTKPWEETNGIHHSSFLHISTEHTTTLCIPTNLYDAFNRFLSNFEININQFISQYGINQIVTIQINSNGNYNLFNPITGKVINPKEMNMEKHERRVVNEAVFKNTMMRGGTNMDAIRSIVIGNIH